jgi:hypothetical protein
VCGIPDSKSSKAKDINTMLALSRQAVRDASYCLFVAINRLFVCVKLRIVGRTTTTRGKNVGCVFDTTNDPKALFSSSKVAARHGTSRDGCDGCAGIMRCPRRYVCILLPYWPLYVVCIRWLPHTYALLISIRIRILHDVEHGNSSTASRSSLSEKLEHPIGICKQNIC